MTTILVVEDHQGFVQSLSRLLQSRGRYEVTVAASGEKALEQLRKSEADLVLIDISLPGRDGIWVLKSLRGVRPGLPCLMLTGFSSTLYVKQSMEAGARGYILKEDVPGIMEGIQAALHGGTFISEPLRA